MDVWRELENRPGIGASKRGTFSFQTPLSGGLPSTYPNPPGCILLYNAGNVITHDETTEDEKSHSHFSAASLAGRTWTTL